ncbi:MAG: hypothetical protein GXO03_04750 [Aquificae bacterium]|nr:hypothetical protein [Aquificota bacterium]
MIKKLFSGKRITLVCPNCGFKEELTPGRASLNFSLVEKSVTATHYWLKNERGGLKRVVRTVEELELSKVVRCARCKTSLPVKSVVELLKRS